MAALSGCAPEPPSGLQDGSGTGSAQANLSVTVMWDPPTTDAAGNALDDLAKYFLYVGTTSPLTRANSDRIDVGDVTTFEVDQLDRRVYHFAVSAVDLAGNESALSESISADLTSPAGASLGGILSTTVKLSASLASAVAGSGGSPAAVVVAPPPPRNLSATAVSHVQIDLVWRRPSNFPPGQISTYRIYRDKVQVGATQDTTFQDPGLEPDTEYEYYVTAVDRDGAEGDASNKVKERTLPAPDETPPSAPADLSAESDGPDKIKLAWTAAQDPESGIASYNVFRDGMQVGSTNNTSFSDTGLSSSTTYSYEVSAVNGEGLEGPRSNAASATTDPDDTPPTAPADLVATAAGPNRIDLAWTAAQDPQSGIDSYRVYRDGAEVGFTSTTSYSDTGLSPSTAYRYEVSAVNGDGLEGPASDPASATTDPDDTPPTAPSGLSATAIGPDQIDLAWTAAEDPESGIDSYNVYRDGSLAGFTSTTSFSDTGLDPSTTYSYEVSAVNGEGLEGPRSDPASATTDPPPADDTPPTAPGDLAATAAGSDQIDLAWTAAEDPESGVTSYNIYRDGSLAGSTAATSFSDTGLDPSTTYTYEVSAVNGEGLEGPRSDPASAATDPLPADDTPPAAPGDLVATATGSDQIDLAWTAAEDPESGVASYNIYRDGSLAGSTASSFFSDTGLDPSTTYSYEVSAVNGVGLEGPRSDPASATTDPPPADDTPPPAPSGLAATAISSSQIDLDWTAAEDPESGIASYNVYRGGSRVGSTAATSFSDTGLDPATAYSYQVSAVNGEGLEGPRSGSVAATTLEEMDGSPPPAPTDLTASAVSTSQVNLTWTAVDDPESGVSGYNIYRDGEFVTSTANTTFADTGLEAGTTYSYQVSAVNGAGMESDPSAAAEATTEELPDTTPPAPPTRLRFAP